VVITDQEFYLILDPLRGVSSANYRVVTGPDPYYEIEPVTSLQSVERIWLKRLPDGRLHVRGVNDVSETLEWVLDRSTSDQIRDVGRGLRDRFKRGK